MDLPKKDKRYLTIEEASKVLCVSKDTLRRWEKKGILPSKRTKGGHRRYDLHILESLVQKHRPKQSEKTVITPEIKAREVELVQITNYPNLYDDLSKERKTIVKAGIMFFIWLLAGLMLTKTFFPIAIKNLQTISNTFDIPILSQMFTNSSNISEIMANKGRKSQVLAAEALENPTFGVNVESVFRAAVSFLNGLTVNELTTGDLTATGSATINSLVINGTSLTSTASELNYLDGLTLAEGGIAYSTATGMQVSAVGTANQIFVSNGALAPSWKALTDLDSSLDVDKIDGLDSTAFLRSNATDTYESGNTLTIAGTLDINSEVLIADTDIAFDGATTTFTTTGDLTLVVGGSDILSSSKMTLGSVTAGTSQLMIDGSSDIIQLQIQGNSTQTESLLVLEQSDGTDIFAVGNTGLLTLTNSGSSNTTFNLSSSGDFVIQDNGTAFVTFNSSGNIVAGSDLLLDLSTITHNTTSAEGIKLPQATSFTAPSTGEGYVAWDSDDNKLMMYNGSAWVDVAAAGGSLWTDGGTITYLTATADDLSVGGTTSDSPLFFDTSASALSLNPHGASAGNTGEARFEELEANGDHYTGLKAPDSLIANIVYTLPSADATVSNQVLASSGAGVLSWINVSAGAGSQWTDGGDITYLTSTTDDFSLGSTTSDSPLWMDISASGLHLNPYNTTAGTTGEIDFEELEANGDHYTGFKAPDSLAGNVIYVLPLADASSANQVLSSNATGTLAWIDVTGGAGAPWTTSTTNTYLTTTTNEVILGGSSPLSSAKLSIDGDTDQIQFIIQGNATQTTDLAVFEQSDGTDVFNLSNAGNLTAAGVLDINGAGTHDIAGTLNLSGNTLSASGDLTLDPAGADVIVDGDIYTNSGYFLGSGTAPSYGLHVVNSASNATGRIASYTSLTFTPTANLGSVVAGAEVDMTLSGGGTNYSSNNIGLYVKSSNVNNTGSISAIKGVYVESGALSAATTGSLSTLSGVASGIDWRSSATAATVYGFYTDVEANSGTFTNTYGVYIGDLTAGTQTNTPYSFYASDASTYNYFSGNTSIGGDITPDYLLELNTAASSDPTFAMTDDDVAHGVTTLANTDAFFHLAPISSTVGGARLTAFADADGQALEIKAVQTTPTDTTPAIKLVGALASGTGVIDLEAADTVFAVANNDNSNALYILGDGTVYAPELNKVITVDGTVYAQTCTGINAAIDALGANGGEVYLPEGTYTCTESITIDANNTTIRGAGKGSKIVASAWASWGTPGHIINLNGKDYLTFSDFQVDATAQNGGGNSYQIMIGAGAIQSVFRNLYFTGGDEYGIQLTTSSQYNTITGSTFLNQDYAGIAFASSSHYNSVENNHFEQNTYGQYGIIATANSIVVANNTYEGGINSFVFSQGNYNSITGNTITNPGSAQGAIALWTASYNSVTGNTIVDDGTGGKGINVVTNSDSNIINGNSISGFSGAGDIGINIAASTEADNVISFNQLESNTTDISDVGTNTTIINSEDGNTVIGGADGTPDTTLELFRASGSDSTFSMTDGDVAHGVTTLANTDAFLHVGAISSTDGGVQLTALADNVNTAQALSLRGILGNTPDDTVPAIKLVGAKGSGTGIVDLAAAETVFQIANNDDAATLTTYGDGSVVVGAPTGGAKGIGTLNAVAVYDDNVLLTDYVFDKYFDGNVRQEDIDLHGDYSMMTLDEMGVYVNQNRHLPTIAGRDEWRKNGKFSLGSLASQLWETAETNSLYILELNNKINNLDTQDNTDLMKDITNLKDKDIELSTKISELETKIALLESQQQILGTATQSGEIQSASASASLTGLTTLNDVVVTGKLNVGAIQISSLDSSIDAIGTLKIQPLALGDVEIMGNLLKVDTKGNLNIQKGQIIGNPTFRGSEILPAGQTSVRINKTWETKPVSVSITPSYNTNVWLTNRDETGFTINVATAPLEDTVIDWIAIW